MGAVQVQTIHLFERLLDGFIAQYVTGAGESDFYFTVSQIKNPAGWMNNAVIGTAINGKNGNIGRSMNILYYRTRTVQAVPFYCRNSTPINQSVK